jgi:6-pyruvoyltetrahydropterin/6-carboxytetrahydropterin synthase
VFRHRIFVGQDQHKFSVAHMTVFPDGSKERLHGHNFNVQVALDLRHVAFESFLDLGIVKRAVEAQCREWNERLLLAEKSPRIELVRVGSDELEFKLCGKRYVVPAEDAVLLPIDNVVVENLSILFAHKLVERLGPSLSRDAVAGIEVQVSEARGQGGAYYWTWDEGGGGAGGADSP